MIIAEHLVPFDKSYVSDLILKGSVADIAHFCKGEERIESLTAGTVAILFAEQECSLGYDEQLLSALGQLFPTWDTLKVAILGRLITSSNEDYNHTSFVELLNELLRCGHYPVVFSSNRKYGELACQILQNAGNLNLASITPTLGFSAGFRDADVVGALSCISFQPHDSISAIATQSYFSDDTFVRKYENLYFQHIRLGHLRVSIRFAEPPLRDANLLLIDASSVRFSDFSSSAYISPNGLYAEEICQLMRYAGFSDNLSMVFFGGFDPVKLKDSPVDIMLMGQGVWHLLDGLAHRRVEKVGVTNFPSKQFFVDLGEQEPLTLKFLRSDVTGRWWLFIPSPSGGGRWIACDAEDYDNAKHHEMPLRWISVYKTER